MARAANRIAAKAENTSSDADVVRRRWLFIDIDPNRPSGISSTETERLEAKMVLDQVAAYLGSNHWPEPITAMSGNGWYLLYPIDLPNDAPSLELVKGVLEVMAAVEQAKKLLGLYQRLTSGRCLRERMPKIGQTPKSVKLRRFQVGFKGPLRGSQ